MIVRVTIDQTYTYRIESASSVRVAINRAAAQHDREAKRRQKAGFQTPRTLSQLARKGGLRIHAALERPDPADDAPPKRQRSVRRGLLR